MNKYLKEKIYFMNIKKIMKNYILFESNPDFSDNSRAVFDEMIRRNYNSKFRLIWFVDDSKKFKKIKIRNVKFITRNSSFLNKIRCGLYILFAKYIIDCNRYIYKRNCNQIRFHLTHGAIIKEPVQYFGDIDNVDYILQISDTFSEAFQRLFHVSKKQLVTIGLPRNDYILNSEGYSFYDKIKRKKTILWMPTYRIHKSSKYTSKFKYGIPILNNKKDFTKLNDILVKYDTLLIIKLHPAEKIDSLKVLNLSNIKFLENGFFDESKLTIYHYLSSIDALITDYSSIYYDYLLLNRPIGLAIPDLEDYKKKNQMFIENFDNLGADCILEFRDLIGFIKDVYNDNDCYSIDRQSMRKKFHKYLDSKSAIRFVDFFNKIDSEN